jgi:hypothetical protein
VVPLCWPTQHTHLEPELPVHQSVPQFPDPSGHAKSQSQAQSPGCLRSVPCEELKIANPTERVPRLPGATQGWAASREVNTFPGLAVTLLPEERQAEELARWNGHRSRRELHALTLPLSTTTSGNSTAFSQGQWLVTHVRPRRGQARCSARQDPKMAKQGAGRWPTCPPPSFRKTQLEMKQQ